MLNNEKFSFGSEEDFVKLLETLLEDNYEEETKKQSERLSYEKAIEEEREINSKIFSIKGNIQKEKEYLTRLAELSDRYGRAFDVDPDNNIDLLENMYDLKEEAIKTREKILELQNKLIILYENKEKYLNVIRGSKYSNVNYESNIYIDTKDFGDTLRILFRGKHDSTIKGKRI